MTVIIYIFKCHVNNTILLDYLTEARVWHNSKWLWRLYLVTDEVPLLLIIILPEETCFIWGQVHRVLKNKRVLSHQNTQEVIYSSMHPWQRPCRDVCARFLWVTAVSWSDMRNPAAYDLTSCTDFLYPVWNHISLQSSSRSLLDDWIWF